MPSSFDYAVIRIVPRVDREEFINAGVVVYCPEKNFLAAQICLREARLLAFAPHIDIQLVRSRLAGLQAICAGDSAAGPIGQLGLRQRFHWVVSPKSTILQLSAVHSGTTERPELSLIRLTQAFCAS